MPKKHVFISYCHDNKKDVRRLRDDLIREGELVWWDEEILPGGDWKLEIKQAMKCAYAVLLCLSNEAGARTRAGNYPEARDAVEYFREYPPGSLFLIPIRLSECEIPLIQIDGMNMLDSLQHVDLFPPSKWAEGLDRLIKALQMAPEHP